MFLVMWKPREIAKTIQFHCEFSDGLSENNFRLGLPKPFGDIWYYKDINSDFQSIGTCYIQTQTAVLKTHD